MEAIIGVDLGATKIAMARVERGELQDQQYVRYNAGGSEKEILDLMIENIEKCMTKNVRAIGVGVPGLVDVEKGIVYDLINILSWKKVRLKEILEEHFGVDVYVNNDANCFVLGEKHFGDARNYSNVVGLSLGTGLGVGLIIRDQLYEGMNCGAGEFGQVSYLQSDYEAYCSGRFFRKFYGRSGEALYNSVDQNDPESIAAFYEFGRHIGAAINSILLTYDPDCIVIGGSIAKSYPHFRQSMYRELVKFPYPGVVSRLVIGTSTNPNSAVLGAAALCEEQVQITSVA